MLSKPPQITTFKSQNRREGKKNSEGNIIQENYKWEGMQFSLLISIISGKRAADTGQKSMLYPGYHQANVFIGEPGG